MGYLIVGLLAMVLYARKVNFDHPPSVLLWGAVMLLAWAAVIYGGVVYALVK